VELGAALREASHRTAAEDHDAVAGLHLRELGDHLRGGKDVRQKQRLLVAHPIRNPEHIHVGERHTDPLGLYTGEGGGDAENVDPRPTGGRQSAAAVETPPAGIAGAAADDAGDEDAVARSEGPDPAPDHLRDTHALVSDDEAPVGDRKRPVPEVQIRAADGAPGHADDDVGVRLQLRVFRLLVAKVARAVECDCLHGAASFSGGEDPERVMARQRPCRELTSRRCRPDRG
jgi:hypothetical protein